MWIRLCCLKHIININFGRRFSHAEHDDVKYYMIMDETKGYSIFTTPLAIFMLFFL